VNCICHTFGVLLPVNCICHPFGVLQPVNCICHTFGVLLPVNCVSHTFGVLLPVNCICHTFGVLLAVNCICHTFGVLLPVNHTLVIICQLNLREAGVEHVNGANIRTVSNVKLGEKKLAQRFYDTTCDQTYKAVSVPYKLAESHPRSVIPLDYYGESWTNKRN